MIDQVLIWDHIDRESLLYGLLPEQDLLCVEYFHQCRI